MKLTDYNTLYLHQLQDLHSAEKQLTEALPKMAKAASSKELQKAFTDHLEETETHLKRLEEIASQHEDAKLEGHKCKAMKGLIDEGADIIKATGEEHVIDAALIAAAQRVEHYEIAAYGAARAMAEFLGFEDDVALLTETIDEEGAADKLLTEIACALMEEHAEEQEEAGSEDEEESAAGKGTKRAAPAAK